MQDMADTQELPLLEYQRREHWYTPGTGEKEFHGASRSPMVEIDARVRQTGIIDEEIDRQEWVLHWL